VVNTLATVASAVAASVAATLAGLNLYLSGRREHTRWARDTLVDILVAFLDASFASKDAVQYALRAGRPGSLEERNFESYAEEARTAELEMRSMQTRLRLLASPAVVESAQLLRVATRKYIALLKADEPVTESDDSDMKRHLWRLRQDFINEAKTMLSLPRPWLRPPRTRPAVESLTSGALDESAGKD
jgi:hypothetical protein